MRGANWKRTVWISVAVIALFIAAAVTYVDSRTNQLLAQASPAVVDLLTPDDAVSAELAPQTAPTREADQSAASGDSASRTPSAQSPETGTSVKPVGKTPAAGTPTAEPDAPEVPERPAATIDASDATLVEKAKAYKLASSKLSAGEMGALIQWSQGGFTQEEKESAKALFYSRFTDEERQWILALFRKYGS